jgi:hypothetical protein
MRLIWRAMNGEVVAVSFDVKQRMEIMVQGSRHGESMPTVDRIVLPEEIRQHRMEASDEDLLDYATARTET